jgi:hypothetical protein
VTLPNGFEALVILIGPLATGGSAGVTLGKHLNLFLHENKTINDPFGNLYKRMKLSEL